MSSNTCGSKVGSFLNSACGSRGLGRLFEKAFREEPSRGLVIGPWLAAANLWEDTHQFYVEIDVPGVAIEDISLTVDKGILLVAAERKAPGEERDYKHQERGYGRVERTIQLPETVDPDKIEAELVAGVLKIQLGKRAELQPKKITVRTA